MFNIFPREFAKPDFENVDARKYNTRSWYKYYTWYFGNMSKNRCFETMERQSKNSKHFRLTETHGSGVMLIIPLSLNPKVRNDLNYMNKKNHYIECSQNNNSFNKQKQLINVCCNPQKSLYHYFLEEVSTISIDHALWLITILIISTQGKHKIWKLTIPYGLIGSNTDQRARIKDTSKPSTHYIQITSMLNFFSCNVFCCSNF